MTSSTVTGSVQLKTNGYWYVVINIKDKDNKRKTQWFSTGLKERGNKRRAEEILRQKINELSNKGNAEPSKVLLCDFAKNWVEKSVKRLQATTFDSYVSMVNKHVYPYFKSKKLTVSEITHSHLERYYTEKVESGLSPNTVKKHHALLRTILQFAVKEELINRNPADHAEKPKHKKYRGDFYNQEEINRLFEEVKGNPIEVPIVLATYFGLRRSEVLGLRWKSVDFDRGKVYINHKAVKVKKDGKMAVLMTDDLKTETSYRDFDLEPQMLAYLKTLKERQEANCAEFKGGYIKEYLDYICVNDIGDLLKPDYVSAKFRKTLAKKGLKKIRFHDLRHSSASLLLHLDRNMKEVQEWLGHSNYQTTANLYAHIDSSAKKDMANAVSRALTL
jgi:integrase